MYQTKDFDYHLPLELIAQKPTRPRDHSRLLLLNRKNGHVKHQYFYNLIDYLQPGDVLVLNNSKVFPARLIGHKKETQGQVEVFLHQPLKNNSQPGNYWECLIGGRVKEGLEIDFYSQISKKRLTKLKAHILRNNQDGTWQVKFNIAGSAFWRTINKVGEVPLPPYIKRKKCLASDKNDYQTVFADEHQIGSAAAPTAGLHFTKSLLKRIKAQGVHIIYVTLHVGLGTFAPVKVEKIQDHKMHREFVTINAAAIKKIISTKQQGGRVIAVGTTSCRALESLNWFLLTHQSKIKKQCFWTDIFIYPGYHFKIIDALVTNFHLPRSSLMMLVSALAGKSNISQAYQQAIIKKYRFFSYGDAMFIY